MDTRKLNMAKGKSKYLLFIEPYDPQRKFNLLQNKKYRDKSGRGPRKKRYIEMDTFYQDQIS